MTIIEGYLDRPIFQIVSDVAREKGVRAFVIGGYVRDCFLGRPCNDIDIVVEGNGMALAEAVGERIRQTEHTRTQVSLFKNFGTAMLRYHGDEIEFVGARKESYRRESRKPIVEDGTLEDDQLRRDFTINAMAFSLQADSYGELVDPFGGIRDLAAGIIRTPLDPDTTYSIRFATKLSTPELKFTIVPESLESMRRMKDRLAILSKERIVDELNKMLVTPRPSEAFRLMEETGLLEYIHMLRINEAKRLLEARFVELRPDPVDVGRPKTVCRSRLQKTGAVRVEDNRIVRFFGTRCHPV